MCELKKYHNTSNTQIDRCMRPLIKYLKREGHHIVACCCGHNHKKYPMTIVEKWGSGEHIHYQELLSSIVLERSRRFYKRDKQGYYYIPELCKNINTSLTK